MHKSSDDRRTVRVMLSPRLIEALRKYATPLTDTVETTIWKLIKKVDTNG